MRKRWTLFLLLSCGLSAGYAQDEHLRALELFKKGQYQDAVAVLEEAIATHPDWYFPILLKGQINLKLKKYEEALANLNDALTLEIPSKEIPKARKMIADAYMALKDYPKAVHAYTELLPLVPESRHFDVYFNRGQCETQYALNLERSDRRKASSYFSKAIVSYGEALKRTPSSKNLEVEAAFQKAFCQYKIGNYEGGIKSLEESIAAFKDVIERNPKEKRAHTFIINLGIEIVEKSSEDRKPAKYDEAVSYIDRYLTHWPTDLDMVYKKGLALQGAKRYEQAIDVLKQVVGARPKDGEALFALGSCQMAAKQYASAIGSLEKALANGARENPSAYSYIANCYQQQKNNCHFHDIPLYEKAVNVLERGVKAIDGPAQAVLRKDLNRKRENLRILKENRQTDSQNHQVVIANIEKLKATLEKNRRTLARNKDLYIQQPTEELKRAIDEGAEAIKADEATLAKEFKTMQGYIEEAKKCGGASAFPHYDDMLALMRERS